MIVVAALLLALAPVRPAPRMQVLDPALAARIEHLARRSPTFRAALRTIDQGRVPVIVGTKEQIRALAPSWINVPTGPSYALAVPDRAAFLRARFQQSAEPLPPEVVLVAIDRPWMETVYGSLSSPDTLDTDLDILLAHEIAGHAAGWARSDDALHGCFDPDGIDAFRVPGCAVEVENEVRADLGLPRRPTYASSPLRFPNLALLWAPVAATTPAPPTHLAALLILRPR